MVHGAGGGGWEYDFWKPVFQRAKWKVVARDLQPSKAGLAKTTYAHYVEQVEGWAKGAKRPLVVIGASMGGGIVLSAAARLKPDLIILVDSVAPAQIQGERKTAVFPDIVKWANGPIKDTRDAMPDSDEKTIQWAWKKWRDESGSVMSTIVRGVSVQKPTCPVLVVWGENDTDIPLSTGQEIAKAFHADMQVYAGTSHVGPLMGRRAREIAENTLAWVRARLAKR